MCAFEAPAVKQVPYYYIDKELEKVKDYEFCPLACPYRVQFVGRVQ